MVCENRVSEFKGIVFRKKEPFPVLVLIYYKNIVSLFKLQSFGLEHNLKLHLSLSLLIKKLVQDMVNQIWFEITYVCQLLLQSIKSSHKTQYESNLFSSVGIPLEEC